MFETNIRSDWAHEDDMPLTPLNRATRTVVPESISQLLNIRVSEYFELHFWHDPVCINPYEWDFYCTRAGEQL